MDNRDFNRREFLRLLGVSSLCFTLPLAGGCDEQTGKENPGDAAGNTVALVKNGDDAYALSRAIELAGGLDFIAPGQSVLLKVALNSPNAFPATTSPFIVSELIGLLKAAGAGDIYVGDKSPTWQDTMNCFEETGIYQAAVHAGAEIVVFDDTDMVPVKPEYTASWPLGFSMPDIFNRVDHIIALPTLRTHRIAGFTMGLKLFVGALPQAERFSMHRSIDFLQKIAEIALCTDKIRLSVLDARQGFNTEGPDSGTLVEPEIIITGSNLVAADAVGLALLKTIGTTEDLTDIAVWDHPTIKRGVETYAPCLCAETLEIVSDGIENIEDIKKNLA